ncbi:MULTISPECIES: aspartate aminotransferase family protein [unclassified Mycolicibacterium]|uniref:aspartate aminotransferase family protein n=1 Tax=unclassified Mycolicibacterium TaxID=2636767 RepID=UPI0012DDD779|nr:MULTISPECIES: aspartate aminotransferase family protein [unclassified Mycolicibacterium]MUL80640.1 aspartate aminotransferase family protein [Mycolicibacterium sp. CBMA 329]MUL86407.1 aspartate aminotransferase family protein [Mycolicibacterium sp. CBMA 331]MUM01269.1 aspartate aminotransferase family protein [Mycolicibacterium sp. CBMA 334]MUM27703.1 aspartate aminotransferase family protein [Mycolicibacterium sp. CBMA 295]MUM36703.1 aspartate aminotransferase family protein [Mycolicibacte
MSFAEAFNVRTPTTSNLFERAKRTIPGGAGSTARLPRNGWKPYPLFMAEGSGSRLVDVDGNTYIDYLLGLGPMILGHRHPVVTAAVQRAIADVGTCFGLPYELEIEAAEKVVAAVPGIEQVRFTNSGSEAVGTAVRLARATTGRRLIVRFEGHYHGWQDTVYWSNHVDLDLAGPADHPRPVAMGPGVPAELQSTLEVLTWNDPESFVKLMDRRGHEVAAVLTEPAVFNTGCILPEPGYLELLRSETRKHGALLIFDEVITGFRFARGGAQEWFGVLPDLTTLAKGLGGGFPVAAVGGTTEAMRLVASGRYSHSGTYNANVVQCAAVSATMDVLAEPGLYERQRALGYRLAEGLSSLAAERGLDAYVEGLGTVFQLWFADGPIRNWRDAVAHADEDLFTRWYQEMVVRGVLFHPLQFENLFVSLVHDDRDIDETLNAAADALSVVAAGRQPVRTP